MATAIMFGNFELVMEFKETNTTTFKDVVETETRMEIRTISETLGALYCKCPTCGTPCPTRSFYNRHIKSACDTIPTAAQLSAVGYTEQRFEQVPALAQVVKRVPVVITTEEWKPVSFNLVETPEVKDEESVVAEETPINEVNLQETTRIEEKLIGQVSVTYAEMAALEGVMKSSKKEEPLWQINHKAAQAGIEQHNEQMKSFDLAVAAATQQRLGLRQHVSIKTKKNGFKSYRRYDKVAARKKAVKEARANEELNKFFSSPIVIVDSISIGGGPAPSHMVSVARGRVHATSKKRPRVKQPKRIHLNKSKIDSLISFVTKRMRQNNTTVEVIGTRKRVFSTRKHGNTKVLHVQTHHENGYGRRNIDVHLDLFAETALQTMSKHFTKKKVFLDSDVKPGMSGWFINVDGRTILVRGRYKGKLIDARSKISSNILHSVIQYTSIPERFWKGFNEGFQQNKPTIDDHKCESNFDVERCGMVAAITCQTIFPCGKITCKICAFKLSKLTFGGYKAIVQEKLRDNTRKITERCPEFVQIPEFFRKMVSMHQFSNPNREAIKEVVRLIGDRQDMPFKHVNIISERLTLGNMATEEQFSEMAASILEIARYLQNRTENIKQGSLASFRNKISAKAHLNMALMCDNQLDKNGNFIWGERGYHAKRFFSNFFDIVNPASGYDKYIIRKSPNTQRKLAIGNLIVSTDMERLRKQLEGEPIEKQPIGKYCTSMKDGQFRYPCCCVTYDDGTPVYSELRMPTKNHLVLGNSGDQKLLDLPTELNTAMYIAKEGFCYLNIFLAMLVNVNEFQAKDFTKMVRDTVVPALGEWPTMMDLATECCLLSAFFPEILTAELPKILVDHKAQTMHIQDTYGSYSTGYHILKANTVSQLIQFASDSLQSEMKHYRVGGLNEQMEHSGLLKKLIKSIYRPNVLENLLVEQPYIMVLSIASPGILIAMHNNNAFELAIKRWISTDQHIAKIATMLTVLAQKVSVANTIQQQFEVINKNANHLHSIVFNGFVNDPTYESVLNYLEVVKQRVETDTPLESNGFANLLHEMSETMEKNYRGQLEEAWHELSFLEKLRVIKRSYRLFDFSQKTLTPALIKDTRGISSISFRALLADQYNRVKNGCLKRLHGLQRRTHQLIGKLVVSYIRSMRRYMPDLMKLVNIMLVCQILMNIGAEINRITKEARKYNELKQKNQVEEDYLKLKCIFNLMEKKDGEVDEAEFRERLEKTNPSLLYLLDEPVDFQAKHSSEKIEKVVAFSALVMMLFDSDRSDYLYKLMNKLRGLVTTCERVDYQSLDDIDSLELEKSLTVDIDLETMEKPESIGSTTFEEWFDSQMRNNRVIPHYRSEGHFMEFTRANVVQVAHDISNSELKDFLIRGAVGSGKSTALPMQLSKKGRVLLLEPTRPLAENVAKQLRREPFFSSPTLQMRGLSTFGSSPIEIMTTGFALHFLAHNIDKLKKYEYIIFDECHVNDSCAIAMRSLLHEYEFNGKILKVSATPPGRETEFKTQFPVELKIEESMTFAEFVQAQGTGVQADMTKTCDNILIYVASYNDVDTLSKMLTDRNYIVSKVDGRTMKLGKCEIQTKGTRAKQHFIVATNIVENGVTLDIDGVVDFGVKVVPFLDMDMKKMSYIKACVSFGERIQRLGRVGRFKEGQALRIGFTQKEPFDIPASIATEAAFLCFCYGLPVMPQNVVTSAFKNCTMMQAKVVSQFELPAIYTQHLVRFDGMMHPAVHDILKKFKLRDSEVMLSKLAVPGSATKSWYTVKEYNRLGGNVYASDETRIPFLVRDIPDTIHEQIWQCIEKYQREFGYGKLTGVQSCKVAYTLQTDIYAIPRTIKIIDQLIINEQKKKTQFESITSTNCSYLGFSLSSIGLALKARYAVDHTQENIDKLQRVKVQILEFQTAGIDPSNTDLLQQFQGLECVNYQSEAEIRKALKIGGNWNIQRAMQDILLILGVAGGGLWMLYEYYKERRDHVAYQGYNKRQRQKLKFRNIRDSKTREVFGDDETLSFNFGEAYTKKGKNKGKTHGMGKKRNKFFNMYGFDPTDFTAVRFVDPLTGATLDESPYTDISLIQDRFGDIRQKLVLEDKLDRQSLANNKIQAYYSNDFTKKALKVDMTPHNPLQVCSRFATIAGFPEREGELRQTGAHKEIQISDIPKPNEVEFEGLSLYKGVRDYNPIASVICSITNESDGYTTKLFGIGFGPYIIANQHLFRRDNGELLVESMHGRFTVKNIRGLKIKPMSGRDMLIIKMPKDFPPFPSRLRFREPQREERVCIVSSNFQTKSISSMISEATNTYPVPNSYFWKHWIDTKDGQCGLPIVATSDGNIVGIHSLVSRTSSHNYYTAVPSNLHDLLSESGDWSKEWKFNDNNILWGHMQLKSSKPDPEFKVCKLLNDLAKEIVCEQSTASDNKWLYNALHGNLRPVSYLESKLVTKHVVKGKCQLFAMYLSCDAEAEKFFKPLMGAYQPSMLNKQAYIMDIMKYSKDTEVGTLDCDVFETMMRHTISDFHKWGFKDLQYITDHRLVIEDLNKKAAVGAMYQGKKSAYLEKLTEEEQDRLVFLSCQRIFEGKMGVWNGSLKAELRPLEKVQMNKTRTFTAAPIDTLLGAKVCVDDFNKLFYSLNLECPWSVGMTKFYGGWDSMLKRLPEGWLYCDADGSQFDSSLTPYLLNNVLQLRLACMEDWIIGRTMLKNLYTELVYTPIATPDGTVIKKFKGNNSGQPSTVVDNTIMVLFAVRYSLMKSGINPCDFDKFCRFFANGDDLILAIHPSKVNILNEFQEYFRQLGLNYDFSSRTYNKKDLWFMSHQAIEKDGILIPKLEQERIVSILEWDRSDEPVHRLEAIVAAMIESWGYTELTKQIRKFYAWVLEQMPYRELANLGKAPYLAETALRRLYTEKEATEAELAYYKFEDEGDVDEIVTFQAESADSTSKTLDAGQEKKEKDKEKNKEVVAAKDVDTGTSGTVSVPRLQAVTSKLMVPRIGTRPVVNLNHLLNYKPNQTDLSNTRATRLQFESWYNTVKEEYGVDDVQMEVLMNGFMVWCIENGTSPNINGVWVMMDGEEQIEYPLKPIVENARPTLRQIMAHFSNLAEAYIELRNRDKPYMPRYGLQRNLTDMSLARYAFDFYEMTSKTPPRAREAHIQMKAAALRNANTRLFGLDGNVGTKEEDTERHTAEDVNRNMHSLLGVRGI
ncbi:polyprotein [Potyvirus thevetiae]|uniref:Genome polyprotein n=1 Tax=Thevetia ringspot virus TaxID=2910304 RepID=A0ABY5DKI9_9POTV|nr:polyprotein [Thevetia ringspot virus]